MLTAFHYVCMKFNLLGYFECVRDAITFSLAHSIHLLFLAFGPFFNQFSYSFLSLTRNHFRIIGYRILHFAYTFPTRDSEPYEFYIIAKWTKERLRDRERTSDTQREWENKRANGTLRNNKYIVQPVRHIRTKSVFANISNFDTSMDCPTTETIEFCIILFLHLTRLFVHSFCFFLLLLLLLLSCCCSLCGVDFLI